MTPADTDRTTPVPTPSGGGGPRAFLRSAGPSLLVDALLPYLVYLVLTARGFSDVAALAWSALPPACHVLVQAVRSRRIEPVGGIVLATIGIGLATSLVSGDARFAVAREALGTVVLAVLLGGSLLLRVRPLVYTAMCSFGRMQRPELPELLDRQWRTNAAFRRLLTRATTVAALVMAGEAVLRVALAYTLPVAVAVPVLAVQSIAVWTGLSALLAVMLRRAVRAGA
ncbi:VC0807 family protein [Pseudonocardia sp. HH130630-07]|uniref:VC0807 family protein n=1 Tax=Pseudonocardia sp. HH130630-07 TaxID=1690815 RepID=UPI0008152D93|nr:VC0807 family protein [Pseudonocardia sp. HH130630-07]ANY07010.1 hypothetical protein AFB00_12700 [Pseudonocardia sp. HH130630-07]